MSAIPIGIVGYGKIAHDQHGPAIAAIADFELIAVADPAASHEQLPSYPGIAAMLAAHPQIRVTARSSILVTLPWGKTDQPLFHNMAIAIETSLLPLPLLVVCLGIEAALGRKRLERWGPRLIDIDIIAYERQEIDLPSLKVPHPLAHEREFVMAPLREIAPHVAEWIMERPR